MNYEGKIVYIDFIFKSLKEKSVVVNNLKELGADISLFLTKKCHILITSTSKYHHKSLNVTNALKYDIHITSFNDYESIISHLDQFKKKDIKNKDTLKSKILIPKEDINSSNKKTSKVLKVNESKLQYKKYEVKPFNNVSLPLGGTLYSDHKSLSGKDKASDDDEDILPNFMFGDDEDNTGSFPSNTDYPSYLSYERNKSSDDYESTTLPNFMFGDDEDNTGSIPTNTVYPSHPPYERDKPSDDDESTTLPNFMFGDDEDNTGSLPSNTDYSSHLSYERNKSSDDDESTALPNFMFGDDEDNTGPLPSNTDYPSHLSYERNKSSDDDESTTLPNFMFGDDDDVLFSSNTDNPGHERDSSDNEAFFLQDYLFDNNEHDNIGTKSNYESHSKPVYVENRETASIDRTFNDADHSIFISSSQPSYVDRYQPNANFSSLYLEEEEYDEEYNNQSGLYNLHTSAGDVLVHDDNCNLIEDEDINSSDEFPMDSLDVYIDNDINNNYNDLNKDSLETYNSIQDTWKLDDEQDSTQDTWNLDVKQESCETTQYSQEFDDDHEQNTNDQTSINEKEDIINDGYSKPVKKMNLFIIDKVTRKIRKKAYEEDKNVSNEPPSKFPKPSSMKFSWVGIVKNTESTKEKKIQPSYAGMKVFFGGFTFDDLKNKSLPVDKQIELYRQKYKKKSLRKKELESFNVLNNKEIEKLIEERIGEIKRIISTFGEVSHFEDHIKTNGYIFAVYKKKDDAEKVVKLMKILNTRQAIVKRSVEYLKSVNKDPSIAPSHQFYVRWPKFYLKKLEKKKLMKKNKKSK